MYICPACKNKLEYVQGAICIKCGKQVSEQEEMCIDCKENTHFFDRGVALYKYPCVRQGIYRMKYKGRKEYLDFYSQEVVERLGEQLRLWNPDAIIGVPLHKARERKRGYNQAEILASQIGDKMGIPFEKKMVLRQKNTLPQKGLDAFQRQNNLKKAFIISQNVVKLNTIVIIDDIYTTGSTMDAVASILKASGVQKVYCLTLAIGE
ncbi:MAG: ComF family protein [Lachnospiraceae bacterium]|nr:ComF family protein [Lachnospiraceae bacterium]